MGVWLAQTTDAGPGEGKVYIYMSGGGTWGFSADAVAPWISDFVADAKRQDNIQKLAVASHGEAHLAVVVDMSQSGYGVWRGLLDSDGQALLPGTAPALPPPITHLWLFPSFPNGTGLAWSPVERWRRFSLVLESAP